MAGLSAIIIGRLSFAEQQVFGFETLASAERLTELGLSADDGQQPRVVPGLLDEIARAAPHRFHREVDAAPSGHDDHRKRAVDAPESD